MTTIRAKLAAIVLALAAAGALAALSPAGPAVAEMSPPCESPNRPVTHEIGNITVRLCLPPECTSSVVGNPPAVRVVCRLTCPATITVTCTVSWSRSALSDRQNRPHRRVDRPVDTVHRAATPSASGQEPEGQPRILVTAAST
jgi:hypothetical protein